MTKKAQGLPFNAIVIAALVLIVLVVLILIFTGRIGFFGKGTTGAVELSCLGMNTQDDENTYQCVASADCKSPSENLGADKYKDCKVLEGRICCKTPKPTT